MSKQRLKSIGIVVSVAFCLATTTAAGFEQSRTENGTPMAWGTSCFYYSIHQDGCPGIDYSDLEDIVDESFLVWEEASCSYFRFVETAAASVDQDEFNLERGNVNLLVWHNDYEAWSESGSVIALTSVHSDPLTGEIYDADIEFNTLDFEFGTQDTYDSNSTLVDLQNTITHEIGHMLGLDHSDIAEATMAAYASSKEIEKRSLGDDDIAGLCSIYPLEHDPGVCGPPHCGLALDGEQTCIDASDDTGDTIEGNCSVMQLGAPTKNPMSWLHLLTLFP